jgi:hypothetical protein
MQYGMAYFVGDQDRLLDRVGQALAAYDPPAGVEYPTATHKLWVSGGKKGYLDVLNLLRDIDDRRRHPGVGPLITGGAMQSGCG